MGVSSRKKKGELGLGEKQRRSCALPAAAASPNLLPGGARGSFRPLCTSLWQNQLELRKKSHHPSTTSQPRATVHSTRACVSLSLPAGTVRGPKSSPGSLGSRQAPLQACCGAKHGVGLRKDSPRPQHVSPMWFWQCCEL